MKRVLLLQYRDDVSAEHELQCFVKRIGLPLDQILVVNAIHDDFEDDPEILFSNGFKAVVTGASGQYDITTEPEPIRKAIAKTEHILHAILTKDFPTFGVCFAHQLWTHTFGGRVVSDPNEAETGTFEVTLTDDAIIDEVFKQVPESFHAVLGHKDSVVELPHNSTHLASTKRNTLSAYRIGENVYCTQFHPELDKDDLEYRLRLYPEYVKNGSIEDVMKEFNDVRHSELLLSNFIKKYIG